MIRFKQKAFIAPLLAAGGGILNGVMAGGTVLSYTSQKKAEKEQQESNERQEELIKEQNRKLEKISEKVRENPGAAAGLQDAMQKQMSAVGSVLNNGKLFAKDIGKLALKHKDSLASATLTGATIGGTTYIAGKAINADMKRSGMDQYMTPQPQQQKQMSMTSSASVMAKKAGNFALNTVKKHGANALLMGGIFGGGMTAMQYMGDKKQIKDQINAAGAPPVNTATQRTYAAAGGILKGISNYAKGGWRNSGQGLKNGWKNAAEAVKNSDQSLKNGWQTFKSHPGSSTLGGISKLFMGGGKKGVSSVAKDLQAGESQWSQKLGKWMVNDKGEANKKALAGSVVAGMGIMSATWDGGQKAVTGLTRKIDPNAYRYQDWKDQQVQ